MKPQITVLDAGGQYCHLIARKVRDLGVYAEVKPSETPAGELLGRKGIIISGGPSSVYDSGSPSVDPALFDLPSAILGICYGQQLMAYLLGGRVDKGDRGEYGLASLDIERADPLLAGLEQREPVWMSHRDTVRRVPDGFTVTANTPTCRVAAMSDVARRRYGVQFHPEVVHTRRGREVLANFLFGICGCDQDWDRKGQIRDVEQRIRQVAGDRNVFFFVSGGVDSTVAYTLCVRALGPERVQGTYVDTGLMREGETEFVRGIFVGRGTLNVEFAAAEFLEPLSKLRDPEQKRLAIGEQFVAVQERILDSGHYLDGNWILGQGTIYPDTIESGGTQKADVIKTHHNRVPGIQRLVQSNRIVEPLASFYKDEVREIGRELGLPSVLLDRHPFPGPGLAIRCLCASDERPVEPSDDGWILPVRSVGVQGDSRSYRPVLALDRCPDPGSGWEHSTPELINRNAGINRVVALAASHRPVEALHTTPSVVSADRLALLRKADAIVRRISAASGFDERVWQFPVVLIPIGAAGRSDSVVLRPVDSVDGMTAQAMLPEPPLLHEITEELLRLPGLCAVFCDLTSKPPATIEWE